MLFDDAGCGSFASCSPGVGGDGNGSRDTRTDRGWGCLRPLPGLGLQQTDMEAKYPDIVTLPEGLGGDFIILRSPKVSGFELMIVWKIHLDEEGTTVPVLDLLPKVPEQVLENSRSSVENIPGSFRSALRLFGIEASIENLIKVLRSEK
ncbi:hypothetical protein TURU_016782 [Turdus rufiventris]|nr:hypothetical protein TURU_016782 [Turdus rufiventris]